MGDSGTLFDSNASAEVGSLWDVESSLFNINTPVDDILELETFALEDLLDEDDLLQEVKGVNPRLIDFLCLTQSLEKLIGYFTKPTVPESDPMSSDDACSQSTYDALRAAGIDISDVGDVSELIRKTNEEDEQIRFLQKFPYIACEVICCDAYDVVKAIMTDNHLLNMIFSILDQPPPMDPRLAGYFHKVIRTLVRRNADYILLKCSTTPVSSTTRKVSEGEGEKGTEKANKEHADDYHEEYHEEVTVSPWFLNKLIKHLDNYSVVCVFKLLLHVANGIYQGSPDSMATTQITGVHINGDWGSDMTAFQQAVDKVKRMWSGAEGTAMTIVSALESSSDPDTHLNTAEILIDMVQLFTEGDEGEVMLDEEGRVIEQEENSSTHDTSPGPEAENENVQHSAPTSAIDSAVEMTEHLLRIVLNDGKKRIGDNLEGFEIGPKDEQNEENVPGTEHLRYDVCSASVAALPVLSQIVAAFSRPSWSVAAADEEDESRISQDVLTITSKLAAAAIDKSNSLEGKQDSTSKGGENFQKKTREDNEKSSQNSTSESVGNSHIVKKIDNEETTEEIMPGPLQAIVNAVGDLCAVLKDGARGQSNLQDAMIHTQWGGKIQRLGQRRLRIVQLLCSLLQSRQPGVLAALAECKPHPLQVCLDIAVEFEWNNILHSAVCNAVSFVLTGGVSRQELEQLLQLQQLQYQQQQLQEPRGYPSDPYGGQGRGASLSMEQEQAQESAMVIGVLRKWARQRDAAQRLLAPLQKVMFEDVGLIDILLDAYDRNGEAIEAASKKPVGSSDASSAVRNKSSRHGQIGYMGYFNIMANTIQELVAAEAEAKAACENETKSCAAKQQTNEKRMDEIGGSEQETIGASEEENRQTMEEQQERELQPKVWNGYATNATQSSTRWQRFVKGELAEIIIVENCLLGGQDKPEKKMVSASHEDDDGSGLDMDMDGFGEDEDGAGQISGRLVGSGGVGNGEVMVMMDGADGFGNGESWIDGVDDVEGGGGTRSAFGSSLDDDFDVMGGGHRIGDRSSFDAFNTRHADEDGFDHDEEDDDDDNDDEEDGHLGIGEKFNQVGASGVLHSNRGHIRGKHGSKGQLHGNDSDYGYGFGAFDDDDEDDDDEGQDILGNRPDVSSRSTHDRLDDDLGTWNPFHNTSDDDETVIHTTTTELNQSEATISAAALDVDFNGMTDAQHAQQADQQQQAFHDPFAATNDNPSSTSGNVFVDMWENEQQQKQGEEHRKEEEQEEQQDFTNTFDPFAVESDDVVNTGIMSDESTPPPPLTHTSHLSFAAVTAAGKEEDDKEVVKEPKKDDGAGVFGVFD